MLNHVSPEWLEKGCFLYWFSGHLARRVVTDKALMLMYCTLASNRLASNLNRREPTTVDIVS